MSTADFPAPGEASPSTLLPPHRAIVRSGARYLGERVGLEIGVDAAFVLGRDQGEIEIENLEAIDDSGAVGQLSAVPSLRHDRSQLSARGAMDVSLVDGFVLLSAGYRFRSAGSQPEHMNVALADRGGHTAALGVEIAVEGALITLGYAHTFAPSRTIGAESTETQIVNPFDGGTAPAGQGRYLGGSDMAGVSVELSWPPPLD